MSIDLRLRFLIIHKFSWTSLFHKFFNVFLIRIFCIRWKINRCLSNEPIFFLLILHLINTLCIKIFNEAVHFVKTLQSFSLKRHYINLRKNAFSSRNYGSFVALGISVFIVFVVPLSNYPVLYLICSSFLVNTDDCHCLNIVNLVILFVSSINKSLSFVRKFNPMQLKQLEK